MLKRLLIHSFAMPWQVRRKFTPAVCKRIEDEITASEQQHLGEIRFVVETQLPVRYLFQRCSARHRAVDLFSDLRVWDTEQNAGVLVYVLYAEKKIEIVVDRGIAARIHQQELNFICQQMAAAYWRSDFASGSADGIRAITALLAKYFPCTAQKARNELPNNVILL